MPYFYRIILLYSCLSLGYILIGKYKKETEVIKTSLITALRVVLVLVVLEFLQSIYFNYYP
ncbi:hypothetical protein BN1013_01589 [Candidatus Rubidus massiliensis]|nr:hypothetical protein BN1013_01589 [Candidatus Rubidus massiliensis]